MYDKVLSIIERFNSVEESLNNPDLINDVKNRLQAKPPT